MYEVAAVAAPPGAMRIIGAMYQEQIQATTETLPLRGLPCHLRRWGSADASAPLTVLLHGWMDVGASWQFVVDALGPAFTRQRRIVALDWRGFGLSMPTAPVDCYHFVDYLADLDALLDALPAPASVDLVGHSMGGNLAMMYAGARPARVRRLVNLEGFGLPATEPAQAPAHYGQWLDELRQHRRGEIALKTYDSQDAVARRLMKTNPRLAADKAAWLARHWARPDSDGRWRIRGDDAHKITSAQLYRADEALALYQAITAPVLCIEAEADSLGQWWGGRFTREEHRQRLSHVRALRTARVADAGHMLHHDQPQAVAGLIERFLAD